MPPLPLNAEQRHSLFLAFKEALQNAVKHAAASSLRVSITVEGGTLKIILEDNGRGFEAGAPKAGRGRFAEHARTAGTIGGTL